MGPISVLSHTFPLRPTARLAAPRIATRLVVWMPNSNSTASNVTVKTR
jgi:hypothetical protein